MGVLDGMEKGMGSYGGECGTSHCNQWNSLCEGWRHALRKLPWEDLLLLAH